MYMYSTLDFEGTIQNAAQQINYERNWSDTHLQRLMRTREEVRPKWDRKQVISYKYTNTFSRHEHLRLSCQPHKSHRVARTTNLKTETKLKSCY